MKTHPVRLLCCLALLLLGFDARAANEKPAATSPAKISSGDEAHIVVDVRGNPAPAPSFFSAHIEEILRLSRSEIMGELQVRLHVVQGRAESFSLGLAGEGEVTGVSGEVLRDWSVRQGVGEAAGKRFLDCRLSATAAEGKDFDFVVRTRSRQPALPGNAVLLTATPGDAVGFASKLTLQPEAGIEVRVISATGMTPFGSAQEPGAKPQFFSSGENRLEVRLAAQGAATAEVELQGVQLTGRVNEREQNVAFRLTGQLRAQKAGARLRLLSGHAALDQPSATESWHVELSPGGQGYELVADREGASPLELTFMAGIRREGDWQGVDFTMPAGAVVPLRLEGLDASTRFKTEATVTPARSEATAEGWRGFLPASGAVNLVWRHTHEADEGALFFTSTEQTEVRVAAGLLSTQTRLSFRILQGKLPGIRCRLEGSGEVLGVDGNNVVGWKVVSAASGRMLEVQFSRPLETEGTLILRSQAELSGWPAQIAPLRLVPEGGVRHSGFLRVANRGAVRIEIQDTSGLMQLAPEQFPGSAPEPEARQVFVFRIPAAAYSYRVLATQIQPEVGVAEIATYELADNARIISAALDLDVREAPLRDWSLLIPADYTVASVTGSEVSDYVAESAEAEGARALRILFNRAVEGRLLLQLRLEKNLAAAAGEWSLPPLRFPGAKSVRGHIGAVATPGYRLAPAQTNRLAEVPLSFFPRQTAGLQQAWRLREPDWTAAVRVEALGQSIQADVFHLYSLKQGAVYGSVLLNYFVVGAPANEWRVEVPASLGNIDVIGQNVRRDWRREGDQVIVSLHQPVLGAATLLITFEQPMSARGGVISPGQVRPLGVQAERGFVQVVSPLQVKHEIRRSEGTLLKLEPTELPAEFRLLTSSPSLATYHYPARPFALEMNIEWYAPGEVVDQVIDFARLASQVSRDGQVVTEATFFVKTRGRKALRLVLPPGVQLWEARADNEIVNARADGDQTLIPLPAHNNPNDPVTVALRLGQPAAGSGAKMDLLAPRAAAAPTLISEWMVRGDPGRVLVPQGGDAQPLQPALAETGFEWISGRASELTLWVLGLAVAAALLLLSPLGWRWRLGLLCAGGALLGTVLLVGSALLERRTGAPELSFAATVVPAGETLALRFTNVPGWRAFVVGWGLALFAIGLALWLASRFSATQRLLRVSPLLAGTVGVSAMMIGLLAQRGGAAWFFASLFLVLVFGLLLPALRQWREQRALLHASLGSSSPGAAGAVSLLALVALLGFGPRTLQAAQPSPALVPTPTLQITRPEPVASEKSAEAIVQRWSIRKDRLQAEMDITVRGRVGESFLLLRPPAVLTDFRGEGLRVAKVERDGQALYYLVPERDGPLTAHVRYDLPVPDRTHGIAVPTGLAASHRITIDLDQPGWEFVSTVATSVAVPVDLAENHSGAVLVLAPAAATVIELRPRQRDLAAEAVQYFAESAQLFVPAPGVVNGFTRVTVRPVQGRMSELELLVPEGFTVGEVNHGPVGPWRFDPKTRRLRIAIEPAQTNTFTFDIESQHGAGDLPFALTLEPLRVPGAAGDAGTLALAFGGDAQPEGIRTTGLSAINLQDFDATLVPRTRGDQPAATLQQVWRYGAAEGRVELNVASVAPEVRVSSRQVVSLDDDRMVMSIELHATITRVGLFRLSFTLPDGLEVEAAAGGALSHWSETTEAGQRLVTLHLNGRTLGEQVFNLTLAGTAPRAQEAWPFPRFAVREATRQSGEVVIVPGKGLRLRATEREKITQLDPRSLGGQQPGTLAFRLLQEDWVLHLGLDVLDPWVTVQSLQEVTLREGQTLTRIAVRYRVDNAAVKSVRVKLPGLNDDTARTVRASGPAVSDIVRVADQPDAWEIRFHRGIAGETEVQIEFQAPAPRASGPAAQEAITTPEFLGARQVQQFVAVRSGGRLELDAPQAPRGWTRADWNSVPPLLQQRSDRSVPSLCFRVAEPEGALAVSVRRHDVAEALKLRVTEANLRTLFAPRGAFLTSVELKVDVLEKSTLRVRLPAGTRLFNTFVNGESMAVVRDGDAFLFYVSPNSGATRTATVTMVYGATPVPTTSRRVPLIAPSLSVPLENVTWRVMLPPGYDLDDYSGTLRLREERVMSGFSLDEYRNLSSSKRSADAQEALSLMQQANSWLQSGDQEKASRAFSQVSNQAALDAASNEDARVQLRNLKTQQTVLGLATRRQRLYLDNRADASRNEQLEQAANLNPIINGSGAKFKPQEFDQLLTGNTAEENTALRTIATRIVDQQLGVEPAPGAIDVTLPERGRIMTFTRSLQVDGAAALELKLDVEKITRTSPAMIASVLIAIAALASIDFRRRMLAGGV